MSSRDGSLDVHFNSYDPSTQRYRPLQIECVDSTSKRSPIKPARRHSPITYSSRSSSTDRSRSRTTDKTYEPFVPVFPLFYQKRFQPLTYNPQHRNNFSMYEFTNFLNIPTITGYWHFVDIKSKQGLAPLNFRNNYPQSFRDLRPNDPHRDQLLQRKYP